MDSFLITSSKATFIPFTRSTTNAYTVSSFSSRASTLTVNSNSGSSGSFDEAFTSNFYLTGILPRGKYLVKPLNVHIEYDEGEFLMSEPHFYIHAVGATWEETLISFRNILSSTYDVLVSERKNLDDFMSLQLQYLRSYIRPAS